MNLYDLLQLLGPIGGILGPVAGAIYTWFATRRAAERKEIDAIAERLEAAELQLTAAGSNAHALASIATKIESHEMRLTQVEGDLKHLPDAEAVHDLKIALVTLEGTVKAMGAELAGVGRTVGNIDTYLRKDDK